MQPPPRQRTAEEERARAAAKQAEKELWERTRGAGSAVFKLAESGRIKPQSRHRYAAGGNSGSGTNHHSASLPDLLYTDSHDAQEDRAKVSRSASGATDEWSAEDVLPSLEEVESKLYEPVEVPSADVLLSRGICDYTLLPKTLGRGKFSTVFVASKNGELTAIKHTALFPHHQLIATRLLREPTLLAELPPHPNLVAVKETIRTPGHFYLVEEYLDGYVTLEALLPILSPAPPHILPLPVAETILTQLLSAVRAIHHPLQICHRDIKPENILVHPETLQLKLLDFGLATHFSKSEAKLSTCCGSPAFHCPEIVKALASPPGSVVYMGPEVDAWTCGVTMLRCLTGSRFPLGASHSSLRGMSIRAQRAVSTISDPSMRERVGALLDMDGNRRMKRFEEMVIEQERTLGEPDRTQKKFKSTSFIPAPPTHSINLPLIESDILMDHQLASTTGYSTPVSASRRSTPSNSRAPSPTRMTQTFGNSNTFVALNPTNQPPDRVISFVKYCLRCAGILHHTWPDFSGLNKSNRHSFLGPHPSHTTTSVSAAFAEAVGTPLDALTTPSTPLFPPTFAGHEDRSDGFGHVQVFQCVIEMPVESEGKESGGVLGQMSLVQSIMAAFGRKPSQSPAASPAASNTLGRQQAGARKASSPSPGQRSTGQRSLSTPAQPRAQNGDKSGSTSKEGPVRCLTFHLIVRFPRQPTASMARHAMTRASSYFGQQASNAQPSWGNRSRASSSAGKLSQDVSESEEQHRDARGGRDGSPHADSRKHASLRDESQDNLASLNVASTEALQHFPRTSNRSPSTSRPASRTRKRSSRGAPKRAKVFFQVTDERALAAVREALSVGGTIDARDLDDYRSSSLTAMAHSGGNAAEYGADAHDHTTPRGSRVRRRTRDLSSLQTAKAISSAAAAVAENVASEAEWTTPTTPTIPLPGENSTHGKDEQPRGRSMTSNRARNESTDTIVGHAPGGIRAPSQLSTVALKEESPTNDDFHQTIDSLARTLSEIVSGNVRSSSSSSSSSPLARSTVSSPRIEQAPPLATDSSPFYDGRQDGMLAQTRSLLLDVSRILHHAERRGTGSVQETLSPVLFPLFAALSPALGLVPSEKMGLPASTTAREEANESTTLRGLAMASLDIVARHASPREVVLAIQERLEVLSMHSTREAIDAAPAPKEAPAALGAELSLTVTLPTASTISCGKTETPRPWMASLEVAGVLRVMSVAVGRLKTNKPVKFIEPLITLVPRSTRGALQDDAPHDVRGHAHPDSSASLSSMSPLGPSDAAALEKSGSNSRSNSTTSSSNHSQSSSNNHKNSKLHDTRTGGASNSHVEMAACEISLAVIALCRSLADWSNKNLESVGEPCGEATRSTTLTLFYASMIALLPALPRPDGYVYLSEWYFHVWKPSYNVIRPDCAPTSHSLVRHPRVDALSSQVWVQLEELITHLQIDVEKEALDRGSPASDEKDTAASAVRTMGAFILHVNLLARSASSSGGSESNRTAGTRGPRWTSDVALDKLQRSMGLLVASLGSDPPATISKDGVQSFGGVAHLPDVALTWAMWCIEGMSSTSNDDEVVPAALLNSEEAILFVQAIAAHAALCPRPIARQISILIVQTALQSLTDAAIARDLLTELITESLYPQLRTASVGLARSLISTELDKAATPAALPPTTTANPSSKTSEGARFARSDFLDRLASSLFNVPEGLEGLVSMPSAEEHATLEAAIATLGNVKSFAEDYGAWLSECLAFVYLVTSKDSINATGIRCASTLRTIEDRLLQPLHDCLQRAKQHLRLNALQKRPSTATEVTEVGLTIGMLDVALERAQDAVRKAQDLAN